MGGKAKAALKLQFDKRLRLEFHGAMITSDGGVLLCRELDGALELTEVAPTYLRETRRGRNMQHELVLLLRRLVDNFRHGRRLASNEQGSHCRWR